MQLIKNNKNKMLFRYYWLVLIMTIVFVIEVELTVLTSGGYAGPSSAELELSLVLV